MYKKTIITLLAFSALFTSCANTSLSAKLRQQSDYHAIRSLMIEIYTKARENDVNFFMPFVSLNHIYLLEDEFWMTVSRNRMNHKEHLSDIEFVDYLQQRDALELMSNIITANIVRTFRSRPYNYSRNGVINFINFSYCGFARGIHFQMNIEKIDGNWEFVVLVRCR